MAGLPAVGIAGGEVASHWTARYGQFLRKFAMFRCAQAKIENVEQTRGFLAKEGLRIKPQTGEDLRAQNAVCAWGDLAVQTVLQPQPQNPAFFDQYNNIFTHARRCVQVALLPT